MTHDLQNRILKGIVNIVFHNAAKSSTAPDVLLNTAPEGVDVILLQEPWIRDGRTLTASMFDNIIPHVNQIGTVAYGKKSRLDIRVSVRTDILSDKYVQALEIKVGNHESFVLVNLYNMELRDGNSQYTLERIRSQFSSLPARCIIAGDFNAHDARWDELSVVSSHHHEVLELIDYHGFELLNDSTPTRISRGDHRNTIIDLAMASTSMVDYTHDFEVINAVATGSDHQVCAFVVQLGDTEDVRDLPRDLPALTMKAGLTLEMLWRRKWTNHRALWMPYSRLPWPTCLELLTKLKLLLQTRSNRSSRSVFLFGSTLQNLRGGGMTRSKASTRRFGAQTTFGLPPTTYVISGNSSWRISSSGNISRQPKGRAG